jgi:hypothetical protein
MRIEKAECSYQVTECDLKFGEQITLDGKLLIPVAVLDKIIAQIEQTRDKDKIAEYPYNRCIRIVEGYKK